MRYDQCKTCRRLGQKLFLKGDRCFSQKCAMIRRASTPGPQKKRRGGSPSEYKKSLDEKQTKKLSISTQLTKDKDYYKLSLDPKDFYLMNNRWNIAADNYIEFGKQGLLIHHLFINKAESPSINILIAIFSDLLPKTKNTKEIIIIAINPKNIIID